MNRSLKPLLLASVFTAGVLVLSMQSEAQPAGAKPPAAPAPAAEAAPAAGQAELTAQDKEVLGWANEMAAELTQVLERWISSNAISEDRLFSRLYYPIADTDPIKYTTDYDALAEKDLPPILEKYLSKSPSLTFATMSDVNGYVPIHNRQFSQPLTGNKAVDLVNNRAKRIFGELVGFNAARNTKPFFMQRYTRDTGEPLGYMAVPVRVRGRHFGAARIGYKVVTK